MTISSRCNTGRTRLPLPITTRENTSLAIHVVQKITIIRAQKIRKFAVWNLKLCTGAIWRRIVKWIVTNQICHVMVTWLYTVGEQHFLDGTSQHCWLRLHLCNSWTVYSLTLLLLLLLLLLFSLITIYCYARWQRRDIHIFSKIYNTRDWSICLPLPSSSSIGANPRATWHSGADIMSPGMTSFWQLPTFWLNNTNLTWRLYASTLLLCCAIDHNLTESFGSRTGHWPIHQVIGVNLE